MAIQNRRGQYADFDPSKAVAGEMLVVQQGDPNATDGKAVYMAFTSGDVKRLATYEDMVEDIENATKQIATDLATEINAGVADNVTAAQTAASTATTKASEASASASQAASTVANIIDATLSTTGKAADAKATGDAIDDLKSALSFITIDGNKGVDTFYLYSNFQHYGLNTDGSFLLTQKYRVSCTDHISFDREIKVSVKSGFRWGYIPFVNGSAGSWSGWKTTDYTLPVGTEFVVQIARVTEDTSEIANVAEFTSALTFSTVIYDKISNIDNKISDIESANDVINSNLKGEDISIEWEQGVVTDSGESSSDTRIRTKYIFVNSFSKVIFKSNTGYTYFYISYNGNKEVVSYIPGTSTEKELTITDEIAFVRVCGKKIDNSNITPSDGTNFNVSGINEIVKISKQSNRINVFENIFRFKPFFSHIGVSQTTNIVIPCQSVADVARSKRLGFNCMELNVQKTSDNKYVCIHGTSGKFGSQFIGADSSSVSDITISSKTLEWIKTNVRFVSKYDKYKTAPFTLEEILHECKKMGIVPLVQYVDDAMVGTLNKIMGEDNYILNLYANNRGTKTNAVCASWTAIADKDDAVEKCEASGQCYFLGVNHSNSAFSNFDADDWEEYVNAIHNAGYYVMGAYINSQKIPDFMQYGWDAIASSAEINDIENGNICNLLSDLDYSDFTTAGTVSNGVLTLEQYQTITPAVNLQNVFLGCGSLHIRFSGKIYIYIGKVATSYESDGTRDIWFSSYFEEAIPTFRIEAATGGATIYDLSYKASRM